VSFDEIKFYVGLGFQVINAIATAGVWLYVRHGDRNKQVDDRFETMQAAQTKGMADIRADFDRRMDIQDKEVARLSGLIDRAPTHEDLGRLYNKVNETARNVSEQGGQLKGISDTVRLILARITERGMP